MFYGVFADSNGDTPQVIGEASLILAQTCFPDDGMAGDVGHPAADVAYIVFGKDTPDGVGEETLDYGSLKALGDQKMKQLAQALNIGAGPSGGGEAPQDPEDPEPSQTQGDQETPTPTTPAPTETPSPPESTGCKKKKRSKTARRRRASHKRSHMHK